MENEVDVTILLPRTLDLVAWLVWLVVVILFLLWDVWKAWKRRAPWIPGQALSVLIIQLLSFIDFSHISLYSGSRDQTKDVVAIFVKDQLVTDSGRAMMCVLIAYLLPGMARPGSVTDRSILAALSLSITLHAVSEVRSDWKVEKRNESFDRIITDACSTIYILVIIYLFVLLMKAVMSGRTICRIRSQKIPSALSRCCTPCDRPSYNDIKDHVLKCWLVTRLYQPDYVLVRTGLCSMAFTVVTVCIGVHVIKQTYLQFRDNESLNSVTKRTPVHFVIFGQCVIVLIGWIILLFRWHGDIFSGDYFNSSLCSNARHCVKTNTCTSKRRTRVIDDGQFSKYKETLKMSLIPGESAWRLWITNQWGLRKVERYMDVGQEDGKPSPCELICLLRSQTVTTEGEVGISATEAKAHLQQANKNSWKRTAVSLIHFMIYFNDGSDASVIEDAMQCYIQAWEYMNFVDGLNEEVKSLGRQADGEFDSLQHTWNKCAQLEMPEREIKQPLTELIDQLKSYSDEERRNLQNSRDWTEVAKNCLFETWTVMDPYLSAPQINKIHLLQRELANVYFVYMKGGLKEAVLEKCWKLAEEGMEEEILDVAILLAKARGVLDKVREGHNTDQGSISSPTQIEIELVGEGNGELPLIRTHRHTQFASVGKGKGQAELPNNTDQGSISSSIQFEIEVFSEEDVSEEEDDEDYLAGDMSEGELRRRLYRGPEFYRKVKKRKAPESYR